jgi:hypothetical protein
VSQKSEAQMEMLKRLKVKIDDLLRGPHGLARALAE